MCNIFIRGGNREYRKFNINNLCFYFTSNVTYKNLNKLDYKNFYNKIRKNLNEGINAEIEKIKR
jgi:hypothetical protein